MTDIIKGDETAPTSNSSTVAEGGDAKTHASEVSEDSGDTNRPVPSGVHREEKEKKRAEAARADSAEAELAKYKQAEAERAEAKKVEQGKYEELLTEYKGKVAELTKTNEDLLSFKDTVLESTKVEVEKMKENIPEGHKDFLNKALEGRDPLQQAELLREALPTWNITEVKSTPKKSGSGAKSIDAWEEAKKKGDIAGMLKAGRNK